MTDDETNPCSRKIDAAIAEYLEAAERGQPLDREAFLARHHDLADELREFLADYSSFKISAPAPHSGDDETTCLSNEPVKRAASGAPFEVLRYFGDYELMEEIARGGMGVVYKARQTTLGRTVAVKMILAGQLASQIEVDRFYAEARAAATLDHPNIVPIFEVGQHLGQHYFSMGFVEGGSLSAKIAAGPLPPREAAELLLTVCQAVQYAHQHGIIHRDLKPANILLDQQGRPRVTDFGLAKRQGGEVSLTASGQILGTPSYMPPEQAAGRVDAIGPSADVYALGAILYAMLAGRPPFQAASSHDTLRQVMQNEPLALRQLVPEVPRDLETIVLKCLEKSIPRRYASAEQLADELQRHLSGRPILARPVSRTERAWRWCKRNPVVASLSAAAASLLVGIAIVSTVAYFRVETEVQAKSAALAAETEARTSETAAKEAEQQQRLAAERQTRVADSTRLATQASKELNSYPQRSLLLAREAVLATMKNGEPIVPAAEETLHTVTQQVGGIPLLGFTAPVTYVAVSPDSHYLAAAGEDYTVRVWDLNADYPAAAPRVLRMQPNPKNSSFTTVSGLSISDDSRWLKVIGNFGNTNGDKPGAIGAYTWDLTADEPLPLDADKVPQSAFVSQADWSFTILRPEDIQVHRRTKAPPISSQSTEKKLSIETITINAPGLEKTTLQSDSQRHWLIAETRAVARPGGRIPKGMHLWDLTAPDPSTTERAIAEVTSEDPELPRAEFSPDGRWLLLQRSKHAATKGFTVFIGANMETRPTEMVGGERAMRIFDLQAAVDAKPRIISADQAIITTAFSADGHWLATGHDDFSVRLWDLTSDGPGFKSWDLGKAHSESFFAVFSPNSKYLYAGGRRWILADGPEKAAETGRWIDSSGKLVEKPLFSPHGGWLVEPNRNEIRMWDLAHERPHAPMILRGHEDDVKSISFSPDDKWMISRATDFGYATILQDENLVAAETVSDRAKRLNLDLNPRLWNLEALGFDQGGVLAEFDSLETLTANRNGMWLLAGSFFSHTALLFDLKRELKQNYAIGIKNNKFGATDTLKDHYSVLEQLPDAHRFNVAFSSDGRWAAIGGEATQIRLINLNADDLTKSTDELVADDKKRYGPDATTRAVMVRALWLNVTKPNEAVRFLDGHTDEIRSLAFSHDGNILASGSWDQTVRLWKVNSADQSQAFAILGGHHSAVGALAFSPDDRYLATGGKGNQILVFDLHAADPAAAPMVLKGHRFEITSLSFNPDGRYLVSGSMDKTVRLWDFSAGRTEHSSILLAKQPESVMQAEFSPDGNWLCAGESLWDCSSPQWTQTPAFQLSDKVRGVGAFAFSTDSRMLASADWASGRYRSDNDPAIYLWRLRPGFPPSMPVMLRGHNSRILALAFGGDGKKLYSTSWDRTLREWTLPVVELLDEARQSAGRHFTNDEMRLFGVADSSDSATGTAAPQNARTIQLPLIAINPSTQHGMVEPRLAARWYNMSLKMGQGEEPEPVLELDERGQDQPQKYFPKRGNVIFRNDEFNLHHLGQYVVYGPQAQPKMPQLPTVLSEGRPKGILTVEMEPDPDDKDHEDFGMPVISYTFSSLAEGKARLHLLDGKTAWEFAVRAPQWRPTGITIELTDADHDKIVLESLEAIRSRIVPHLSARQAAQSEGPDAIVPVLSGAYADHNLGIEYGTICECRNNLKVSGGYAYLSLELRKSKGGNAEWYVALMRSRLDEVWVEIDGHEIFRLPAITERNASDFPVRVESF